MIFSGKAVKNGTKPVIEPPAGKRIATAGVTKGSPQAGAVQAGAARAGAARSGSVQVPSALAPKPTPQGVAKAAPLPSAVGNTLSGANPAASAPGSSTVIPGSSQSSKCQDGLIASGNVRARSASSSCWW